VVGSASGFTVPFSVAVVEWMADVGCARTSGGPGVSKYMSRPAVVPASLVAT
jgi:hypothetical protein